MKQPKYTSRPFPINEQNQAHWRLNLPHAQQCPPTTQYNSNDCADQELGVIIGNTKVASHDNELQEKQSPEYLQAVGLGKEIRYDLASITVKFMLLKYKDQPTAISSFTHSERAVLHGAIKQIVMAAELLRATCAGNSDHKYAHLKRYIDRAHLKTYFDENNHKCKAPVGWLQRNIYKIHARLTNYYDIITFSDGRRADVVKMAALQPYLSPDNELRKRKKTLMNFAMLPYDIQDIQADTCAEQSSLPNVKYKAACKYNTSPKQSSLHYTLLEFVLTSYRVQFTICLRI
jgi:hypothetical protein